MVDAAEKDTSKNQRDQLTWNKIKTPWGNFAYRNEPGSLSFAYQLIDTANQIRQIYSDMEKALKYLAAEPEFSPELYAPLAEIFANPEMEQIVNSIGDVAGDVDAEVQQIYNEVKNGKWKTGKNDFLNATFDPNAEIAKVPVVEDTPTTNGTTSETTPEAGMDTTISTSNRYEVTPYTIVYQEYENGTAFLMNFNDYRVIVELGGKTYTLEAYGYLVVSQAA